MKHRLILLIICILFCLSACSEHSTDSVSISVLSNNVNDSKKSTHIIWENRNDYVLIKSTTKENDEITKEHSYSYNQYGKIMSEQVVHSDTGEIYLWITCNYLYDDFGVAYERKEQAFNYHTKENTEGSSEIFCDDKGNIICIKETNTTEPCRYEWKYDDNGNQTHYRFYINDKLRRFIRTYYDDKGRETNSEEYLYSYDYESAEEYKFTYVNTDIDENNISFKVGYNEKGDEKSKVKFLYDNNGNIIKETHYKNGLEVRVVEHQYELKENIVKPLQEGIAENEEKMRKSGAYVASDKSHLLIYNDTDGYYIELNIVGLTHIEGTGEVENEDMIFNGTDARGQPIIMRLKYFENNTKIVLSVEDSKWDYLPNGETFSFIKDEYFPRTLQGGS